MKKRITTQRYSRNRLRALAVLFAAHEILHMDENGLVKRTSNEKDVDFDITKDKSNIIVHHIKTLEAIIFSIFNKVKIDKRDNFFFIERYRLIEQTFLDSGITKDGVSPHMVFVLMLFTYFADGKAKKHEHLFDPLTDITIYDTIFDQVDSSQVFNWIRHSDAVLKALQVGVGHSSKGEAGEVGEGFTKNFNNAFDRVMMSKMAS